MTTKLDVGRLAYKAYCTMMGLEKYPAWKDLTLASRAAWTAVAEAAETRRKP
jgi:hypothetical protein